MLHCIRKANSRMDIELKYARYFAWPHMSANASMECARAFYDKAAPSLEALDCPGDVGLALCQDSGGWSVFILIDNISGRREISTVASDARMCALDEIVRQHFDGAGCEAPLDIVYGSPSSDLTIHSVDQHVQRTGGGTVVEKVLRVAGQPAANGQTGRPADSHKDSDKSKEQAVEPSKKDKLKKVIEILGGGEDMSARDVFASVLRQIGQEAYNRAVAARGDQGLDLVVESKDQFDAAFWLHLDVLHSLADLDLDQIPREFCRSAKSAFEAVESVARAPELHSAILARAQFEELVPGQGPPYVPVQGDEVVEEAILSLTESLRDLSQTKHGGGAGWNEIRAELLALSGVDGPRWSDGRPATDPPPLVQVSVDAHRSSSGCLSLALVTVLVWLLSL